MYQDPWYSRQNLNYEGLSSENKWIAEKLYHIHNKDIDFTNSVRMPTQYQTYELKSAISADELEYPVRSLDCSKTQYCIMNQRDTVQMLKKIYEKQTIKDNILKYQCPVCKSKSYTSEGKNKKISNLFFDKQMQFYIQLAKQRFQQFVAKSKQPQPKKKMILKRFKNSSLKIYKNGRVQFLYRDTFDQKTEQKICQLLGPTYSKVQTQIYFNPFDQYDRYIKNRDILKIVDRFLEKGIIEYMKQSVNKAQILGIQNQTIQKYINTMNQSICQAYEKNITFSKAKETINPLVMIVRPEEKQAKYLLLKVFYPYQRAWNDYQVKMDDQQKSNMIQIIQRNTQIYVDEKTLFLISPKQSYKISLDVKKSERFEQKQFQSSKTITSQNGVVIFEEKGIKNSIMLPKEGIASTLTAKRLIQPSFTLQLQGLAYYDKSLFYIAGRKVVITFDRENYPSYDIKALSNQIHYFDRSNKKWVTLTPKLPTAVHSPTIIQKDNIVYIIGGVQQQKQNATIYSQDIIIFNLKTKKIIETKKIEKYHYKSMYFVTQSMTPGQYILVSCKEARYDKNKFTKALIFDINEKDMVGEFQMPNKWAKRSEEEYWKTLSYTLSYPSVSTNYQGINFLIATDIHNDEIHQLYYGSDSCWLRSGINEKLI